MADLFRFVPSSNACDICQDMEGIYDYEPSLPVHPNCDCRAVPVPDSEVDDLPEDCEMEIRNVKCQFSSFSNIFYEEVEIDSVESDEITASYTFDPLPEEDNWESWDHEDLKELSEWEEPPDDFELSFTIPAGVREMVLGIGVEVTTMICVAELWAVCTISDEDDMDVEEEDRRVEIKIGSIGGGISAVTNAEIVETYTQSEFMEESDATDDSLYYEWGDEVPL